MRKYYLKERFSEISLKWSYFSFKCCYIGYKVTVVLEKNSLTFVLILIHKGVPHDTKNIQKSTEKSKTI